MSDIDLLKAAEEFGTPLYIFDIPGLKERMKNVHSILGSKIGICYSIKANPFLIPAMLEVTDKLEVCSPGELEICMALKVPPERIIYSGVMKTQENVREAAEYGVGLFTAESLKHVRLINEQGLKDKKRYSTLLRLNAGSQFGMSEEDFFNALDRTDELKGLKIVGIHYFTGTGRHKLKSQLKDLEKIAAFTDEIKVRYAGCGWLSELCKLEYGPGLPFPYFEGDDFSDTLRPLKELADRLKEVAEGIELTVEMGRFFASECGSYVTQICDIKSAGGTNYCIIDGGINHINYYGQVMGMKVPVIRHLKNSEGGETVKYAITGSLCTTADIPVREKEFTGLSEGDLLVFENIGAYSITEGMYLFLSRNMPAVVLYREDGSFELVREHLHTSQLNRPSIS